MMIDYLTNYAGYYLVACGIFIFGYLVGAAINASLKADLEIMEDWLLKTIEVQRVTKGQLKHMQAQHLDEVTKREALEIELGVANVEVDIFKSIIAANDAKLATGRIANRKPRARKEAA
jgi:hypothetical protein